MGGFTGSDPAMTVEKLAKLVEEGELRHLLLGGRGGPGGRGGGSDVTAWVQAHRTLVRPSEYGGASAESSTSSSETGTGMYRLG